MNFVRRSAKTPLILIHQQTTVVAIQTFGVSPGNEDGVQIFFLRELNWQFLENNSSHFAYNLAESIRSSDLSPENRFLVF